MAGDVREYEYKPKWTVIVLCAAFFGLGAVVVNGQRFMHILHSAGRYTITASMLPSKAAYAEVCGSLAARVGEVHAAEPRPAETSAGVDPGRRVSGASLPRR